MGRPLKIGLYSPFFGSTVGGGEKYFGVTVEAVRDAFPGHQVEVITPVPVDRARYEAMLGLDLSGVSFRSTTRRVTWLHRLLNNMPSLRLYRDLVIGTQAARATSAYDLYLAMVYVIPIFSRARYNVMLCQFPYRRTEMPRRVHPAVFWIYSLPYRLLRPLVQGDDVGCYQEIICQSQYVRRWVQAYWNREPLVINPPIDVPSESPDWGAKRPIVLSVGRFFRGGHTKRHDAMIRAFRALCEKGLTGWELHLAGAVHREGHNAGYFEEMQALAAGYPIHLHGDASYAEVQDLYRQASLYWHAAGYEVDPDGDPSLLEHFGMTTAEAMGHGVVPVAIASGGQPEVVEDGNDGYLWRSLDELQSRTLELVNDPAKRRAMGQAARVSAQRFSRDAFKGRMVAALTPAIQRLEQATGNEG